MIEGVEVINAVELVVAEGRDRIDTEEEEEGEVEQVEWKWEEGAMECREVSGAREVGGIGVRMVGAFGRGAV